MKRLIILLFIIVVIITGCGKKKISNLDIELEKGSITSVCTKVDDLDGVKIETITTTNYGADQYAINYKVKVIYTFTDNDQFKENADAIEKNAPNYQGETDSAYKYEINNDRKEIVTVFAYVKLSLDDILKEQLKAGSNIKDSESSGETCVITGASRSDLGI